MMTDSRAAANNSRAAGSRYPGRAAQVALYGAVPVLVLALVGGCVLPREMMPEQTQKLTLVTPHGWALDAYRELLNADPSAETLAAIEKGLEGKPRAPGLIAGVLISSPEFQRR